MNAAPGTGKQSLARTLGVTTTVADLGPAALSDLGLEQPPDAFRPGSAIELASAVAATPAGHGLVPIGAGTGLCLGRPPSRVDLLLDLTAMNGVIEHSAADFVVTVQAGTRLIDLQEHLAATRQWLPVEPPDAGRATLGGMIGGAATSALAASLGDLRAHLLGLRFVRGDSRIARAGGKVVKNVSGYDLMKLLHGSLGTLGVVVEATFRTRPRPERDVLWSAKASDLADAITTADVWRGALRQDPAALWVHVAQDGSARVLMRLQGASAAVETQTKALKGGESTTVATGSPDLPAVWQDALHVLARGPEAETLHLAVAFLPGRRHDMVAPLVAAMNGLHRPAELIVDMLRGVAWCKAPSSGEPGDQDVACLDHLRAVTHSLGARVHVHSAPRAARIAAVGAGKGPAVHATAVQELEERIRHALDPRGILAPGRLTPEPA